MSHRYRRGSESTEAAFLLPLLVLLLGLIVDGSWYLSQYNGVLQAARDGARSGSTLGAEHAAGEASSTANQTLDLLGFDSGSASVTATVVDVAGEGAIEVVVDIPHTNVFGLPWLSFPTNHEASATFRLQDQS